METAELKYSRLIAQHLIVPTDAHACVRDLCGVQAQFLSNSFHALRIRSTNIDQCDPNGFIKSWTLRGTMHLFDEQDLSLMLHKGRTHALRPCDTFNADEWISAERKQFFAELIRNSVCAGINEREALKRICFEAGMLQTEAQSVFNSWGGLLRALCEAGKLSHAVSEKKAFLSCAPFEPMEKEAAELELARRYFTHYAPATIRDAAYFFGCSQSEVKRWLAQLPVKEKVCGGRTYYYIEEIPTNCELPSCIFLAGFDPLMLGYEKTENPFLPTDYLRDVFSMSGIVVPTLLIDGSIAGRWKRTGRRIDVMMFTQTSMKTKTSIEEAAEKLWPDLNAIRFL